MVSVKREHSESESNSDSEDDGFSKIRKIAAAPQKRPVPKVYLDKINVKKLDFDREKGCSVTLSRSNVYCCLSCGKYLQGRGQNSVAFKHAIEMDHHVFLNLSTLKVYVLPETYEVDVASSSLLMDIVHAASPSFESNELPTFPKGCYDLNGKRYTNGFVGMNNLTPDGYSVVVLQALAHIIPLRDYFLLNKTASASTLVDSLSLLIRKLWSCKLLRKNISPHELLNHASLVSKRRFPVDDSKDPRNFLLWLISSLCASREPLLIQNIKEQFMGYIEITSTPIETTADEKGKTVKFNRKESETTKQETIFWLLSLDLPQTNVFSSGTGAEGVSQIKLETLLQKYTGSTEHHTKDSIRTYRILKHPKFLILHFNRFNKGFSSIKDRNKTLVEFSDHLNFDGESYQLVANITHNCSVQKKISDTEDLLASRWKVHLADRLNDQWYEFDDIEVNQVEKEFLFLKECYLQIWKRV
ncbi:unnamed protein product [Kluyveromyces dobzhanskii CBS 2104]|uniref:WGS project CCBQ000000000 data, contig 00012 n=1 Tax=Kluyveromyces dobzhanskii CBS 2104 TaxID=1427455 RepID=A0A0A8L331_9SACH|nr:unnamed protein product [Kluyveromyces dobzhanskii CBS 2104]